MTTGRRNNGAWIGGKYKGDSPSIREGFEKFDEDVRSVVENRKTGLVTVRMEWSDRFVVPRTGQTSTSSARMSQIRARAIEDADSILEFLNEELEKTSAVEIRQAMFRLIEMQLETISFANARPEYAFKIIDSAVVMDEDMYSWPNRALLVLVGCIVGGLVFIAASIAFVRRR